MKNKMKLARKMLTRKEREDGVIPFNGAAWNERRKNNMRKSGGKNYTGKEVYPWGNR